MPHTLPGSAAADSQPFPLLTLAHYRDGAAGSVEALLNAPEPVNAKAQAKAPASWQFHGVALPGGAVIIVHLEFVTHNAQHSAEAVAVYHDADDRAMLFALSTLNGVMVRQIDAWGRETGKPFLVPLDATDRVVLPSLLNWAETVNRDTGGLREPAKVRQTWRLNHDRSSLPAGWVEPPSAEDDGGEA